MPVGVRAEESASSVPGLLVTGLARDLLLLLGAALLCALGLDGLLLLLLPGLNVGLLGGGDKLVELLLCDDDVPAEEGKELALHLVDLLEGKEVAPDDGPGLVGIGIVHGDLGREHEGGQEESVRGGCSAPGRRIPLLQAGKEEEALVDDGDGEPRPVEGVGDELDEDGWVLARLSIEGWCVGWCVDTLAAVGGYCCRSMAGRWRGWGDLEE